MQDDLLKPSLDKVEPVAILSAGAIMAAAFFGGVIAVAIVAVMNSLTLKRLQQDVPMLVALAATGVLVAWLCVTTVFADMETGRAFRIASRAGGFAAFGVAWIMHRPQHRAMSSFGLEPRKPWGPVIAAVLIAALIQAGIQTSFIMNR